MIRWAYAFLDRPRDGFTQAATFWTAVTGTRLSASRGEHSEFATLLPDEGDACVKVQAVAQGPGGAHLDLAVDDVDSVRERARELGAATVAGHDGWAVLRSPAGQLFCVVPWNGESTRAAPFLDVGGGRSRLDQICVDAAPAAFEVEAAFWGELTGWGTVRGALPEFAVVPRPAEQPIRIMVQRLGDGGPDEDRPASAHPDLACSDVELVRARHEELGAVMLDRRPLWTVMRDPAGGVYCLTSRDPDTGRLP